MGCLQSIPESPLQPRSPAEPVDYYDRSEHYRPSNTDSSRPEYADNIFELVIRISKELEAFLVSHFDGTGKGLHEILDSVEGKLNPPAVRQIRYLATFRNKVVHHEYTPTANDRTAFINAYEQARSKLHLIITGGPQNVATNNRGRRGRKR